MKFFSARASLSRHFAASVAWHLLTQPGAKMLTNIKVKTRDVEAFDEKRITSQNTGFTTDNSRC